MPGEEAVTKQWYHSRTLWTNVVMFIGVALLEIGNIDMLTPELQASIITGVNVLLRLITKQGLTAK